MPRCAGLRCFGGRAPLGSRGCRGLLRGLLCPLLQPAHRSLTGSLPQLTSGSELQADTRCTGGLPARRHNTCCPALCTPQRDKFEEMLRRLTVERADICAAMAFALDNAESGGVKGEVDGDARGTAQ